MTTRYLRPIPDLRTDAQEVADRIGHLLESAPGPEQDAHVDGAEATVVELTAELIDELEEWRALLGQQLTVEPCGVVTVMVAADGIKLVVERKPIRDGGVPS